MLMEVKNNIRYFFNAVKIGIKSAMAYKVSFLVQVIFMVIKFYHKNKTAGLLQVPYLLWVLFATYLNFSIYILNR